MFELKEEYNLFDKDIDDTEDKVPQKELEDKEIINRADQNCSQKIEINIIIIFFVKKMKNFTIEKRLYESLQKFNDDGEEFISYVELIKIMKALGLQLLENEADTMIREAKAHIMSDLRLIIGIIAFSVVFSTLILVSILGNEIDFEITGKVLLILWIVGIVVCILVIIMGRREYKKSTKIPFLIKEICKSAYT